MRRLSIIGALKVVLVAMAYIMATSRATAFWGLRGVICESDWLTILQPCNWWNVNLELIIWSLMAGLLVLVLYIEHDLMDFFRVCKQNWLIFVFILWAFISLSWTIQFEITLYKAVVLLFTSLFAIYIGFTLHLEKILKTLVLYYVFICFLNLLFVIKFPQFGIMQYVFYRDAWSGIFWHRNYLGCFMSLGVALFLINLLSSKKIGGGEFFLNLVMLILSAFLLIKSKSATAIITTIVLLGLVTVLYFWSKWHQKLKLVHYFGFLTIAAVGITLIFTNLEFLLGLFGHTTSLTGRVPLWEIILRRLITQQLWFGYGYGAIWHLQGITNGLAQVVKWPSPVVIGDNGFIDIQLHLGVVGLTILLSLIILGFIRGIKYFLHERTLVAAFPVVILVFTIVANISLSLILESETFVWLIVVTVLVSIASHNPALSEENKKPNKSASDIKFSD